MEIKKVTDAAFRKYGKVVKNVDFTALVEELEKTPCTAEVVYEPSVPELEALPVYKELQDVTYGEMPIQIGFCNGNNYKLKADVEEDYTYDTSKVEAFLLPKGVAVELYATTLHYAPCNSGEGGFRCAIVLPDGTNLPTDENHFAGGEDALITAKNKWLIGHAEGGLPEGCHIGLKGENISVK